MIKSVSIQNFGGIETARFDCGKFNVFQGDSDNGKSTFLQALQWCIVGGNDEYLIRNGSNTAEVVLFSDNGSRIERRLTRGGTNKLFVYNRGDVAMPKPQEIINKLYNPVLFDPSSMVRMSSKELNSFVSDSIGKRIKFKPEEIKFYKLEELDLSEDPIEVINKHYKSLFEKRTEVNRNVKNMAAKMGSVPSTKVTKEEVEETDKLLLQKQIELNKALEHNAKIDISKKNQLVKDTTKQNINTLQEEINAAEIVGNLEDVENTLKEKRETINKNKNVYDNNKKTYDTIATTLTKLDGNITCPLHPSIVCKTDLTSYKKEMETQQIELKKNIKVFEVDHPNTQSFKIQKINELFGTVPDYVTYVPVNLETQELSKNLMINGYKSNKKTLFIMEGLIMYIPPKSIEKIFSFILKNSGSGSSIIFDYYPESVVNGSCKLEIAKNIRKFVIQQGEPLQFGIEDGRTEEFLDNKGFKQIKNIRSV